MIELAVQIGMDHTCIKYAHALLLLKSFQYNPDVRKYSPILNGTTWKFVPPSGTSGSININLVVLITITYQYYQT